MLKRIACSDGALMANIMAPSVLAACSFSSACDRWNRAPWRSGWQPFPVWVTGDRLRKNRSAVQSDYSSD